MPQPKIVVLNDPATVGAEVANLIVEACQQAVMASGRFTLVLAGGSTPFYAYEIMSTPPDRDRILWEKTHVFFGDERCVPPSDEESNYKMADGSLLSKVPIPPGQVHRMKGEDDPDAAAKEYGQMLKQQFGEGGPDVVLLGMGEDGHTASLFPGSPALDETEHRCVATVKPDSGQNRITLTAPFLNKARLVIVMVTGEAKAKRLADVLEGETDPKRQPIQMIDPESDLIYVCDVAAAGMDAEEPE